MSQRTSKATADVIRRLALIRALALAANNDPRYESNDLCALEFFHATLDCLEGKSLDQLKLVLIDRQRVERYLKEG